MANVDYQSEAKDPGTSFQPNGFLGGMVWDQNRQRFQQMSGLQDQMTKWRSANEVSDYNANQPVQQAKRLADIETAKATASTIGRQKAGELSKLELDNQKHQDLYASEIAAELAKNKGVVGEQYDKELNRGMEHLGVLVNAAKGPGAASQVAAGMQSMGIDPQSHPWAQHILEGGSPEEIQARLKATQKGFDQASTEHRRKMELEKSREESNLNVAREHTRGQIAAAQIRASTHVKNVSTLLDDGTIKTLAHALSVKGIIDGDPDSTPKQKLQIQAMVDNLSAQQERKDKEARLKAEGSPLPGQKDVRPPVGNVARDLSNPGTPSQPQGTGTAANPILLK